jgi:GDPmannose 4,6-dehydratase
MTKVSLISGITGQDGSYLADLLLHKNHTVIGLHRRNSTNNFERISHIKSSNFKLEEFDLTDSSSCNRLVSSYKPDYFFNLAAQSHVGTSFKQPITTFEIDTIGVVNVLESIRNHSPKTKLYQASTSEMFGKNYSTISNNKYQDENTQFIPQSPYGIAKLASHRMVQIYREAYGLFTTSGILFNHESPRRGENFVTRKITKYIAQLVNGIIPKTQKLSLGNLSAHRDWGHAKDYVRAMVMMLEHNEPDDFVISTGETHSVQEFCEKAFSLLNLSYQDYIYIDPDLYRPCEVEYLKGDNSKAKNVLGWTPNISFDDLVKDMVYSDIEKYNASKKF